eukprot:CAMPEP_0174757120 /NCGR_PEP_ID=MMETSP1094-20130205/107099_1 /TAXON_ID=156173 /ORGANISM="Chrysochromulina brevifilum, Strain UTEX LB 985" /LENGTH=1225 /DNA_ID=CAMNT_0015963035 /DNA_START=9 /DNA_END=3687 /DNA_ORIENTATION=+
MAEFLSARVFSRRRLHKGTQFLLWATDSCLRSLLVAALLGASTLTGAMEQESNEGGYGQAGGGNPTMEGTSVAMSTAASPALANDGNSQAGAASQPMDGGTAGRPEPYGPWTFPLLQLTFPPNPMVHRRSGAMFEGKWYQTVVCPCCAVPFYIEPDRARDDPSGRNNKYLQGVWQDHLKRSKNKCSGKPSPAAPPTAAPPPVAASVQAAVSPGAPIPSVLAAAMQKPAFAFPGLQPPLPPTATATATVPPSTAAPNQHRTPTQVQVRAQSEPLTAQGKAAEASSDSEEDVPITQLRQRSSGKPAASNARAAYVPPESQDSSIPTHSAQLLRHRRKKATPVRNLSKVPIDKEVAVEEMEAATNETAAKGATDAPAEAGAAAPGAAELAEGSPVAEEAPVAAQAAVPAGVEPTEVAVAPVVSQAVETLLGDVDPNIKHKYESSLRDILEEFFSTLEEQRLAEANYERCSSAHPGDGGIYDEIYAEFVEQGNEDPHAATRTDLQWAAARLAKRLDKLGDEYSELYDGLMDIGIDIRDYLVKTVAEPEVRRAESDPKAESFRKGVDRYLESVRPVRVKQGYSTVTVPTWASDFKGIDATDQQASAVVDDLVHGVETDENDLPPTEIKRFSPTEDAEKDEEEEDDEGEEDEGEEDDDDDEVDSEETEDPTPSQELVQMFEKDEVGKIQRQSVQFVLDQFNHRDEDGEHDPLGAVIANEMGLGKTIVALAVIETMHKSCSKCCTLIVAPLSVCTNWINEATKKFAKGLPSIQGICFIDNYQDEAVTTWKTEGGVLVVTYDTFANAVHKNEFDWEANILVVDEAHCRKTKTRKKEDAAPGLREAIKSSTPMRILLTGTPVRNELAEFYHLLELAVPGWSGCDDLQTFERLYGDVCDDGERCTQRLRVLIGRAALAMYRACWEVDDECLSPKKEFVLYLETDEVKPPTLRGESIKPFTIVNEKLRDVKLEILSTILKALHPSTRVLVFSQTIPILEAAHNQYKKESLILTGKTSLDDRNARVKQFQKGKARIFFMALHAGGVGLNLQAASVVIHLEPSWVPANTMQATARAWRLGQTQTVRVYHLICKKTIEKRVYDEFVVKKSKLARRLDGRNGNIEDEEVWDYGDDAVLNALNDSIGPKVTKHAFDETLLDALSDEDKAVREFEEDKKKALEATNRTRKRSRTDVEEEKDVPEGEGDGSVDSGEDSADSGEESDEGEDETSDEGMESDSSD